MLNLKIPEKEIEFGEQLILKGYPSRSIEKESLIVATENALNTTGTDGAFLGLTFWNSQRCNLLIS